MRFCLSIFAALAVVGAASCHKAPQEIERADASPVVPLASSDASTASTSAANDPDSGLHAELHEFCLGAYSADHAQMREKCSMIETKLTQNLAQAAAGVCTKDLATAIGRSRAGFDAEAGRKCVEMLSQKKLAQRSENDTLFQHFPCDRVLLGMQGEDQPCLFSVECKDDLACVGYAVGKEGTCKKPPAAGEACTPQPYGSLVNVVASAAHHPACAAGAYCDGTTCQPRIHAGKACSKSEVCASGLSCVMGKCGPRTAAGTACASSTDCTFGLWCDQPGPSTPGKCAAKRDEGQACTAKDSCKGRCDIPRPPGQTESAPGTPGKCVAVCGSG